MLGVRLRLHVLSTSLVVVPFKNATLWNCLHISSKRSKVPLIKPMMLTVRVNRPLLELEVSFYRPVAKTLAASLVLFQTICT